MLQDIRETFIGTTGKIVLAIILLLLAGTGLNYTLTPERFIAKVDGEEVSLRAVQAAYQSQLSRFGEDQELPEALLAQLQAIAVQDVINRTALELYLRDEGYAVSDAEVAKAIVEEPAFQTDGKFDRQLYEQVLKLNRLTPAGFEQSERRQMMIDQFQQNLAASAFVTPGEFTRLIELSGQEREVEYATIAPDAYLEDIRISDEQVASWYEANPLRFQTPERLAIDYLLIDEPLARARIDTSDATLLDYYEGIKGQYEGEEQRRPRHILLSLEEDEAAARALAQSLLQRVRDGEAFEDLAREYSSDGGSARNGGDLGWVARGDFVGPVEDAVFSMQPGQISDVVESRFGLHIIRLDEVRAGDPPSFAEVREDVTERYVSERLLDELTVLRRQLDDQYFERATLEQMAETLGTDIASVEDYAADTLLPFGQEQVISDTLFGVEPLPVGELSEPLVLAGDRTAVIRVTERTPAGRQPLAAVSDEVRALLRAQAADAIAAERGAQLAGALRAAPQMDFETLTLNSGAEIGTKQFISRRDASVPAALTAAVFEAPAPQAGEPVIGSVSAPGTGFIIYRLSAVKPGSAAEIPPQQLEAGRRQLALRGGNAQLQALVATIRDQADVEMGDALQATSGGL